MSFLHQHGFVHRRAASAIGHGAVPVLVRTTPPAQPGGRPPQQVIPSIADVTAADHPLRAVKWEYRDFRPGEGDAQWARHGFAVVDLSPDGLHVQYIDDEGKAYAEERI